MLRNKFVILVSLTLLIISYRVNGQNSYYATEDTILSGAILKSGTEIENSKYITLLRNGKKIPLYPDIIDEYGLTDGRVYVAEKLPTSDKNVFLQKLTDGDYELMYLKEFHNRRYFFRTTGSNGLIEFSNKETLESILDRYGPSCADIKLALKITNFSTNGLVRFFNGLNDCNFFPLEKVKYGFGIGLNSLNIKNGNISNRYLLSGKYPLENRISIGLYLEIPIEIGPMRFLTGLNYVNYETGNYYQNLSGDVSTKVNLSSIDIPTLVKGVLNRENNFRPFAYIGFTWKSNIKNENTISVVPNSINRGGIIYTDPINEEDINHRFIASNYLGYSGGIGFERSINTRYEISTFVDFTYYKGFNNTVDLSRLSIKAYFIF